MKTSICSLKPLAGSSVAVLAIALSASTLSGCAAVPLGALYVAQLVPTAMVGYSMLPGGAKVEVANPGKGIRNPGIDNIKSILTDNTYAKEYLENEELFKKVALAKETPKSPAGAATMARKGGFDGFFLVDSRDPTVTGGLVMRVEYGKATVRLIRKDGTLLYEQTATLSGRANTPETPTERQVAEALATAIVADLKQSIGSGQATASTEAEENVMDKTVNTVKGWFN